MAPNGPEKILAFFEVAIFIAREQTLIHQHVRGAHLIQIKPDPEQRVQIAQSPFAIFDIGLDLIAAFTGFVMTAFALVKLCLNKISGGKRQDFIAKPT